MSTCADVHFWSRLLTDVQHEPSHAVNSLVKVPLMKADPYRGMCFFFDLWEAYLCRLRRQCMPSRTPI